MTKVTQADRDAAWRFRPSGRLRREVWDNGIYDDHPSIQAFAAHRVAAESDNPWRDAVLGELQANFLNALAVKDYPRQALGMLLHWERSCAIDPKISEDAQALLDRGAEEERGKIMKWLCEEQSSISITNGKMVAHAIEAGEHLK